MSASPGLDAILAGLLPQPAPQEAAPVPDEMTTLLAQLGITPPVMQPPVPAQQFHTSPLNGYLERISGPLSQVQGAPTGLGSGLALGLARSVAGRGSQVAQARAKFETGQKSLADQRTAANLAATAEYNKERLAGIKDITDQRREQARYDESHPVVTAPMVKDNPGLTRLLGKRVPVEWTKPPAPEKPVEPGALSDPTLLDPMIQDYVTSGTLPRNILESGKAGNADKIAFRKELQKRYPGINIAANRASYASDKASLAGQQAKQDNITQMANALDANAEVLKGTISKMPDSGNLKVNDFVRGLSRQFGNSSVTDFNAALTFVKNQASNIINSGGNLSAKPTIEDNKELHAIFSPDFTKRDLLGVLAIIEKDKVNRLASGQKQIDAINARLTRNPLHSAFEGGAAAPDAAPHATYDPATDSYVITGKK